jgi:hypothetical protein
VLEHRVLPSAYVVTTTADSGPGSLRDAINQINADTNHTLYASPSNPSVDEIDFDITAASDAAGGGTGFNSATGVATIAPLSALPTITTAALIDGYTQPAASANTLPVMGPNAGDNAVQLITLDGSNISSQADGLTITAGGSTVEGLFIQNFSNGVHLTTNGNDVVAGNYLTNTGTGVFVDNVPNNTIGGTTPEARNIIATNGFGSDVLIQGDGATGNQVQGDYIGTDGQHQLSSVDNVAGVRVIASSNIIGGTAPGSGNVIASDPFGIRILPGGNDNVVEGNYIGTDATGTVSLTDANFGTSQVSAEGIWVQSNGNTIGGTTAAARNVISGYEEDVFFGLLATNNVLEGNYIGTDATGTKALNFPGGFGVGVIFRGGATGNVVGGVTPGSGNLISGIPGDGIALNPTAGTGNLIEGNFIGTDYTGNNPLPNDTGVAVFGSQKVIGGTAPGTGNTIAFNNGPAVEIGGTGDAIEGNSIYGNSGPAIDNISLFEGYNNEGPPLLDTNWPGGPFTGTNNANFSGLMLTQTGSTLTYSGTLVNGLPNTRYFVTLFAAYPDLGILYGSFSTFMTTDANGQVSFTNIAFPAPQGFPGIQGSLPAFATASPPHSLGNYEQNYPVLSSASSSASNTSVTGTLNGQANTTFRIEFFSNPSADPSGYGQGQTFLGDSNVTTDANGNVTFTTDLAVGQLAGQWITATATDPSGNTSQFSADVQSTTAPSQTYAQYLQAALPQSSTTANSMTIQASPNVTPATVIQAVNGLTGVTKPVTIILDLGGGTYSTGGVSYNPTDPNTKANVTFVVQNGTLDPVNPALTVAGGVLSILHCTLTTSGNAPTLLVTGGSVTLVNDDIIQASTTATEPAIAVTGGMVNLGTAANPGNNTLSVNSSGDLVSNTTGNPISAVGDTFVVGGTVETAPLLSFASLATSAANTIPGQPVTLTATVVPDFPGSATPTGTVDFYDTTTNTGLGTVTLSGGMATLTTSAFALGTNVIQATYGGDGSYLPSVASLTQTVTPAIYVLNSTASGALNVSGNAIINIPDSVVVDSSSKTALTESTNAQVKAGSIQVVGGVSKSSGATLSPAPVTGTASVADPLAAVAAPSGGTSQGAVVLTKGTLILNPGLYSSITVSGTGHLILNAGVYQIGSGGITVSGGTVSGSGVLLYNTGALAISGTASVTLTATASGPYANIAIFQARADGSAVTVSGSANLNLNGGALYAANPHCVVSFSSSAVVDATLVVNELTMSTDAEESA